METAEKVYKPKNKGTKVLFNNPVVEKLTRTHIAVPISIFVVFAIALLYVGFTRTVIHPLVIIGIFVAGFLIFTLIEYIVHRYLFHMGTESEVKVKIQYAVHGIHHEYPKDKDRLAMPPLLSSILAAVFFFSFRAMMGDYVFAFLPGFVLGYASYLFVHYIVHAYQPPKNFFKILWINHGIHHYKDHDVAFGVSSPLWDVVFRTLPK
ncbi:MAG TPA: sterol desaturase family protein [Cytophagales bacterium]|nr:sterol desaturase family protein [Cytophagales bacterium]